MHVKHYILLLLVIFISPGLYAQNNRYQFLHLDITNGLSHNQVNCIYKDAQGFMWFGTMSGLNRYDGYTFKIFRHEANNPKSIIDDYISSISEGPGKCLWIETRNGFSIYDPATGQFNNNVQAVQRSLKLPDTTVTKIEKDSKGNYWFMYTHLGVYVYNSSNGQIRHYSNKPGSAVILHNNDVASMAEDSNGNIWLVYNDGFFEMLDIRLNRISNRIDLLNKAGHNQNRFYSVTIDSDNDVWLYATNADIGLYLYSPAANTFRHIDNQSVGSRLNTNVINNVVQADDGLIWIATDHGGINILDKKTSKITYLLNREDDDKSLRQNSLNLYKDNTGIMWAGTFKEGISYYHKNIIRFPLYSHFASDPNSLSFEDVDKFAEDKTGNLWIGTNGGGLIYFNRKTGKYTQYKHNPANNNSLANDIIVSLCIDHNQGLWIGTYFGGLDKFDGKTFTHYVHNDAVPGSISDNRIWSLMEDDSHRLWVGTFAGGVSIFNPEKQIFYSPFKPTDIWSPYVSSIFEDRDGNIWIGGYMGVAEVGKKDNRIIHYRHLEGTPNSLVADNVNSITQDSRGLIWIATRDGLSILNPNTNKFTSLLKESGLPDNSILNVLEDNSGIMWLSTSGGLCRITLTGTANNYSYQCKNFDEGDGLQGREFNMNAALKTSKDELIFGGGHGFNIFDPAAIQPNITRPNLVFTDFQLFNKTVEAGVPVNGHVILAKSIPATNSITLNHSDNVFTIEFAMLNYFNPSKVKYQYMLENFDKDWLSADNVTRKATYTNIDGGDYTFKVRASNSDGAWNPAYISLKIHVRPPFWKTPVAYIIYVLIVAGILLLIRNRGIQKIKRQFAIEQEKKETQLIIEQERQEIERMHEIDRLKTKFLTNVSHEFRTPLSLIMAPVDKMLHQTTGTDEKQQLNMIRKNARRLLNLVNQLLDFRKMEAHELKLNMQPGDIVKFIKEISLSFGDIAQEKSISFAFDSDIDSLKISFDHDKIERILFNLLSNAFKFTSPGGNVAVLLNLINKEGLTSFLEIKVIDTGIGIPEDKQKRIFDRFFQNDLPASVINQGSGIGLSITKEFVSMHQGEIFVESEPDRGSCFIIHLPVLVDDSHGAEYIEDDDSEAINISPAAGVDRSQTSEDKKKTVLLVDDNDDFRFYLKDNLKDIFYIIEAANGKEGWQKALALHPDIMVSDITMPEMNGKDLCIKIKNDSRTSHIPVILLTALTGEEEELKSLEIGANDYMTKPFNFEILVSKIKNLLALQATFKKTYTRQVDYQLNEPAIPSADEKFVKDIIGYINDNMLNPSLSVNELSKHMGMNRNTLYKKLLTVTGKSPVEYIRLLRLRKAAHLLEHSQMNIAEVSYEVGFNTPQYFAKSFKEEYNMLPSEFVAQKRKTSHVRIDIT